MQSTHPSSRHRVSNWYIIVIIIGLLFLSRPPLDLFQLSSSKYATNKADSCIYFMICNFSF